MSIDIYEIIIEGRKKIQREFIPEIFHHPKLCNDFLYEIEVIK